MSKFRSHKYEWSKPFTSVRHQWSFVGPDGGISFHVSLTDEYGPSCGLEFHRSSRAKVEYSGIGTQAPSHSPCWLLGEPCWHDGTSLYASESVWPYVEQYLRVGDHDRIFRYLEGEYVSHFERHRDEEDEPQP